MKNVDTARQGIDASLKALGLEYLDLYLLHQAMGDYFSAWRAPLGGGRYNAASNPVLSAIADRHHKSVSQVMLRWNVQRGVIVLPKSVHAERIQENILIWDFTLSDEEMAQISSLDMGYTGDRVKQLTPDFIRMRIHEVVHP